MTRRWPCIVIAVLCYLLTVTTSASAEGAWVLGSALTMPALPDNEWGVVIAYPAMQECEAGLAKEFTRLKREGWEPKYVQIRTVVAFKGTGEKIAAIHYRCLPDTVDPRGPRGK